VQPAPLVDVLALDALVDHPELVEDAQRGAIAGDHLRIHPGQAEVAKPEVHRGARGLGLSLELTAWSRDLVLCTDGPPELDANDLARLARNGIRVRDERVARLEGTDGLERVVFAAGEPLARRALFFTTGQHPQSRLAHSLGCEINEKGTVRTGRYETTHLKGLYVAGDASRAVQWVVVAAAEGAEAAFDINTDLLKEDLL